MTNLPDHDREPDLDLPDPPEAAGDDPTSDLREGPLWRHAVAAVTATVLGLALGWAASTFRLGSPEFGIPSAAPGSPWPLLAVCGAAGLAAAVLLRLVSARIPVYGPGRAAVFLVFVGTRLALAFRPEAPVLAAGCAAGLFTALSWCGLALWTQRRAAGRQTAA